MKVCLRPRPDGMAGGGVRRRLEALWKHLPAYGVQFVDRPNKADLIHCHAIAEARGYAHSMVYTNHGVYELTETSPKHEWQMNEIIVRNLRQARRIISVAEWPTRIYEDDLGVKANVVPNGVDLEEWDAVPRGRFRQKHGLERPFLLWAKIVNTGVCDPMPALELAKRLPQLDVVSTFAPRGATNLPKNFKVVGRLPYDEMKMALADCALNLATTKENFAVQTIEAMALGKPILAFNWGGNSEAIRDGVEGALVAPNDHDALAFAALRCLEESEGMGKAARKRVEERYQWKDLMAQVYQVYEAALSERVTEQQAPKVVVVVPHYNYQRFLPDALESVKRQTFQDWECVIVDDGSKKDPAPVIKKYLDDRRFRLVRQENAGVSVARNRGIAESSAPYVACLDADDAMEPEMLSRLVAALDADEGVGIAYGRMRLWKGSQTFPMKNWPRPFELEALKRGNVVPTCCLFRRRAWESAGGYPPDPNVEGWAWEDYELWLTIAKRGWGGTFVEVDTFKYRQHGESRVTSAVRQAAKFQSIIRRRHPELWGPGDARPIGTYDFQRRTRGRTPAAQRETGKRMVRFKGKGRGRVTFHGPKTGSIYRFSALAPEQWVDERDVPHLKSAYLSVGETFSERVTIIVPCYNHARFLPNALDSALGQDYSNVEIVVVDDGSDDDIEAVLVRYEQLPTVKIIRQSNMRLAVARNVGIANAKEGFILPLDADDELAPGCVTKMMRVMKRNDDQVVVYSDFWMFGAKSRDHYQCEEYDFDKLLNKNLMSATSLFPKKAWEVSGGYKDTFSRLGGWEDYEFWVHLGKLGYCGVRIPEPLWGYRQHKESMRKNALRNKNAIAAEMMRIHPDIYGGKRPMACCGGRVKSTRSASGGRGRATAGSSKMGVPGAGMVALWRSASLRRSSAPL